MIKKYNTNKIGKDYICGDIHGCFSDLELELEKLNFDKTKDNLFSVGDLVDRGPESKRVLEFLKEPWFFPIRGNHEDMILQCYADKSASPMWHWQNGGIWITELLPEQLEEYLDLIKELPLIIQVGNIGIIHALPSESSWNKLLKEVTSGNRETTYNLLWERTTNDIECSGIDKIFAGHTIGKEVRTQGILENIDTGAFLKYYEGENGFLTVKELK